MSEIENYEDFLNERKSREERKAKRAKKKIKRADRKVDKAEDSFESGRDKKGARNLRKAEKKIDKARELDSDIDTVELDAEIADMKDRDWEEEFDVVASKLGKKIKVEELDFIKKFKIKGDEISPDELILFLRSVKSYINEFWDEIGDDRNKEEYLSPYSDNMIITVKNRKNEIVFLHKEKQISDKIKLIMDKEHFEDKDNLEDINDEFDQILKRESLTSSDSSVGRLAKNYRGDKDKNNIIAKDKASLATTTAVVLNDKIEDIATSDDVNNAIEKLNTPNPSFISEGVKLLIDEELNLGGVTSLSNTDEDKIFKYFAEINADKTVVGKNIDGVLKAYRDKKAMMQENNSTVSKSDSIEKLDEAWYDNWEDFKKGSSDVSKSIGKGLGSMSQSIVGTDSKGVVQDLMYAFNTNSEDITKEINKMIRRISKIHGEEITKEIIEETEETKKEILDTKNKVAEPIAEPEPEPEAELTENMLTENASSTALGVGGAVVAYKSAGMARKAVGGVGRGAIGLLAAIPVWGWIALVVIGATVGIIYALNSFGDQRYQLAKIFLLMYCSQSEEFMKEIKRAGIKINGNKKMQVDMDAIKLALVEDVEDVVESKSINRNDSLIENWSSFTTK